MLKANNKLCVVKFIKVRLDLFHFHMARYIPINKFPSLHVLLLRQGLYQLTSRL